MREGEAGKGQGALEVAIDAPAWPHVVHDHDKARCVFRGIEHTIAPYPNAVEGILTREPLSTWRPRLHC